MPKFSQTQLDRIKQDLKIRDLAQELGLKLVRKNGQFVTQCLWHDDNEPSLFIHPEKNLFNCFGCDAGGDVIEWVMKRQKLNFTDAVNQILDRHSHLREGKKLPDASGKDSPLDVNAGDPVFLRQVIDFYHQKLLKDDAAQSYLMKRGILDSEAIKVHKIGFADRDLGRAIPNCQRQVGKAIRKRLSDLGINRQGTGHGHFNGCVVFPVIDCNGDIREIYGRKINDNLRTGSDYHMYLPKDCRMFGDRGIWNEKAFQVHQEMIVCESVIDAMSFWCGGYRNVTCAFGVEGFTEELFAAIGFQTKTVLLAFDRDKAGESAVRRYSKRLIEMGKTVYRIDFPAGMDANEYSQKVKAADGETSSLNFDLVVRSATWLGGSKQRPTGADHFAGAEAPISPSPLATKEKKVESKPTSNEDTTPKTEVKKAAIEPTSDEPAASCLLPSLEGSSLAASEPSSDAATNGSGDSQTSNGQSGLPALKSPQALPAIEAEIKEQEISFEFGDRQYRVRGLDKNHSYDTLKINLLVRRGEQLHVDTFDLYQSRPRATFIKVAALELSFEETIIKRDVGNILLKLEQLQDEQIKGKLSLNKPVTIEIEPQAKDEALKLLKDEKLLDRILEDFEACGVVGEENNKLIGYLAAISRKLNDPLAILIQSSSAAGKSSLMDAVLSFVPDEDKVIYSAMTGQSLYYMGGGDLKHKILAISEEEGVRQASYALKLLQSEGSLRIASTGKDANTGRMETQEYTVEGPVMLFLTTTSYDIDEELQNRCLTLSVCEDRKQTQAIHEVQRQRQTIEGLLSDQDRGAIILKHQNAQRLLKPLLVANNFATQLKFRSDRTRTRRDHAKYLTLIRTIALLHQHQREIKTIDHHEQKIEYIEVTQDDIAKADKLAAATMSRSYNELPDKTEQVLRAIVEMVHTACIDQHIKPEDYRFTRKAVNGFLLENQMAISTTHLKRHFAILEDCEYLIVHSGGGRGRLKTYQLEYEPVTTTKEVHKKEQKSASSPLEVRDFLSLESSGKNGHCVLQT